MKNPPGYLDSLYRLYSETAMSAFPHTLMSVVADLLSPTWLTFDDIDLENQRIGNFFDRPLPMPHQDYMARWEVHCREHPGIIEVNKGSKEQIFVLSDFLTKRQFKQTGLYRELAAPFGVTDQVSLIINLPGQKHFIGVGINRDKPFTADEVALVRLLHPHLAQAYGKAKLLTELEEHRRSELLEKNGPLDFTPWRRHGLSRRECEVLEWVIEGKRNSEIAIILGISAHTVRSHVGQILARLHVETRSAAAATASEILRTG